VGGVSVSVSMSMSVSVCKSVGGRKDPERRHCINELPGMRGKSRSQDTAAEATN
jgi:hypothetical protein